ncbi:MAG: hypothetical protein ACJAVS_001487 [Paracoccaceae bacterium]|jgi:hypothetical protein
MASLLLRSLLNSSTMLAMMVALMFGLIYLLQRFVDQSDPVERKRAVFTAIFGGIECLKIVIAFFFCVTMSMGEAHETFFAALALGVFGLAAVQLICQLKLGSDPLWQRICLLSPGIGLVGAGTLIAGLAHLGSPPVYGAAPAFSLGGILAASGWLLMEAVGLVKLLKWPPDPGEKIGFDLRHLIPAHGVAHHHPGRVDRRDPEVGGARAQAVLLAHRLGQAGQRVDGQQGVEDREPVAAPLAIGDQRLDAGWIGVAGRQ